MTYGSGYEPKIFFACGGPNLMVFPFRVEVLYLSGAGWNQGLVRRLADREIANYELMRFREN